MIVPGFVVGHGDPFYDARWLIFCKLVVLILYFFGPPIEIFFPGQFARNYCKWTCPTLSSADNTFFRVRVRLRFRSAVAQVSQTDGLKNRIYSKRFHFQCKKLFAQPHCQRALLNRQSSRFDWGLSCARLAGKALWQRRERRSRSAKFAYGISSSQIDLKSLLNHLFTNAITIPIQ